MTFTKEELKKQKLEDEHWDECEVRVIKYFNRELKEGTKEYDLFQRGDL